jgi:serine/threonine protein kinase
LKKCDQKGFCVKIADFGLIAIHDFPEQSHTSDKGTVKYMAPEVISRKYNTKADIYSLGVIFQNLFALDLTRLNNYFKNLNFIQFSLLIFQSIR